MMEDVLNSKNDFILNYENKRELIKGYLLGFFIGLAIIIPGVSGAAIAIIFSFYEKLLLAISQLFKNFKKCILFLLPIIIGGIIGIVLGFLFLKFVLNSFPFVVISLFAGLMLGSFPAIKVQLKDQRRTPFRNLLFILGAIIPIVISVISLALGAANRSLANLKLYHYILFIILGYAVAITQIVPGLSATALLMVFGYFTPLFNAIGFSAFQNISLSLVFACLFIGFVLGLLTFSKMLSEVIDKHRVKAFNLIAGLSIGSVFTMFLNPEIYAIYCDWGTNGLPILQLIMGIVLFLFGMLFASKLIKYENLRK